MPNIEQKRRDLEKKKEKWFSGIKFQIEQIEIQLGKMEKEENFTLKKDNHNYFYQNDTSRTIESHLKKIKEIFDEAEDKESSLIMEESDEEELTEKSANIEWTDYLRAVKGGEVA